MLVFRGGEASQTRMSGLPICKIITICLLIFHISALLNQFLSASSPQPGMDYINSVII